MCMLAEPPGFVNMADRRVIRQGGTCDRELCTKLQDADKETIYYFTVECRELQETSPFVEM